MLCYRWEWLLPISHFSAWEYGSEWTSLCVLQVNKGGAGGGEPDVAGGGVEQAVVCCPPSHNPCQHQALALTACPLPDADAGCLPLPACRPCHARCTCRPTVGRTPSFVWAYLHPQSQTFAWAEFDWRLQFFFSFILVSLFFAAFYVLATEDIKTMKQDIWNYVANKKKSNNSLYVLYFLFCSQSSHPLLSLGLISMNFMRWSSEMVPTPLPCLVMVKLWNFLPF